MTKMDKKSFYTLIRKAALVWGGICSLIIGFVFFFIPFVPGFIFGIIGIIMISRGSRTIKNYSHIKIIRQRIKAKLRLSPNMYLKKLLMFF